ncbi:hypothetical protein AKJ16_DCAP15410 [Drosera capensis]
MGKIVHQTIVTRGFSSGCSNIAGGGLRSATRLQLQHQQPPTQILKLFKGPLLNQLIHAQLEHI